MANYTRNDLLAALGEALHNWSSVEIQLATLFYTLSEIPRVDKGHAVFSAIVSFETRLDVVDRLVAMFPSSEIHKLKWAKLSSRLSKFYKKRHELAHFSLGSDKDLQTINPFFSLDQYISRNVRHLTLSQVMERGDKFMELQAALHWFDQYYSIALQGYDEDRISNLQVPPLLIQIHALAAQSLEERKARDQ